MEIINEQPPNIEDLRKIFKIVDRLVFAYSPNIYNPGGRYLDPVIVLHEEVHIKQQGDKPREWWARYIVDPSFRFCQELEAYQVQYRAIKKKTKDRNKLHTYLHTLAVDLSSKTYGSVCSYDEAIKSIKENVKFKV